MAARADRNGSILTPVATYWGNEGKFTSRLTSPDASIASEDRVECLSTRLVEQTGHNRVPERLFHLLIPLETPSTKPDRPKKLVRRVCDVRCAKSKPSLAKLTRKCGEVSVERGSCAGRPVVLTWGSHGQHAVTTAGYTPSGKRLLILQVAAMKHYLYKVPGRYPGGVAVTVRAERRVGRPTITCSPVSSFPQVKTV
ncbi:hypothetical protein Bbelb_010870 [Branchiostoma belcheri]|nr:hypothetical protein Bbelb_010870 [Branchiostoma belcheri]